MKLIETPWWALPLSDEWHYETEDDTVIVTDNEGVGSLEFTVLELDTSAPGLPDVQELARELIPVGVAGEQASCGPWQGLRYEYAEGSDYCRDWLLYSGDRVLLLGYTCELDNRGMDDAAVDQMLAELQRPDDVD